MPFQTWVFALACPDQQFGRLCCSDGVSCADWCRWEEAILQLAHIMPVAGRCLSRYTVDCCTHPSSQHQGHPNTICPLWHLPTPPPTQNTLRYNTLLISTKVRFPLHVSRGSSFLTDYLVKLMASSPELQPLWNTFRRLIKLPTQFLTFRFIVLQIQRV